MSCDAAELLVVGHVARDLIGGEVRLGGPAAYASRAAACLGVRTHMWTAVPREFELLAPIEREPFVTITKLVSEQPTCFELDYSGPIRKIWLRSRACEMEPFELSPEIARVPVAYVVPVIGEFGAEMVASLNSDVLVVGAQGWLRKVDDDGRIIPGIHPAIFHAARTAELIVFSELDHPDSEMLAVDLSLRGCRVVLTRAAAGVSVYQAGRCVQEFAAAPARERESTGAGDVFGVVLAISMYRGLSFPRAIANALEAAARVVEGPGMGTLPSAWRQHFMYSSTLRSSATAAHELN